MALIVLKKAKNNSPEAIQQAIIANIKLLKHKGEKKLPMKELKMIAKNAAIHD